MKSALNPLSVSLPSPLERISLGDDYGANVFVKRDDLIHPIIAGNKFRKLEGNLKHYYHGDYRGILSFGGAYSNHLHALGYCCAHLGIDFVAIIRGEKPKHLSPMLEDLLWWGVQLEFVSRTEYRQRQDEEYLNTWRTKYPNVFIIPEGGSNQYAYLGVSRIWKEIQSIGPIDYLFCPVGSGGTFCGLAESRPETSQLIGVSVLKGIEWKSYLKPLYWNDRIHIWNEYHHGGYAKKSAALEDFITHFEKKYCIPLEPIYSGKLFYAFSEHLGQNPDQYYGKSIVLLHTGGLQGSRTI